MYAALMGVSALFFMIVFVFWKTVWRMSGSQMYYGRTNDQRTSLIMNFQDLTHHFIAICASIYLLYISCGNEDGNPWLSEKGGSYTSLYDTKRWGFFKDDVCFMEYNKGYGMIGSFTIGYCISGFVILRYKFEKKTKLTKQMEWHHIILISGFVAGIIAGYGYPGNMCCVLLAEISSIFLNIKEMFSKDCRTTCPGQTNQIAFFLTFTVFRIITFPFLVMRSGLVMVTTFHLVSPVRKFFMIFAFV